MANPIPLTEKTFRAYTSEQGSKYAQNRRGYHPNLYKTIFDHHTSTGGQLGTVLDIGCGPGIATRELAPTFTHAIGLDPSEGMISTARAMGGGENIRYKVSSAEELGKNLSPPIADASIDLITAATAAHWFDMAGFWPSAARVLKPGGTVAIWTSDVLKVKESVPNAAAIQARITEIEEEYLVPYMAAGNLSNRNLYRDMLLPWTITPPVLEFDENTYVRKEWGSPDGDEFYSGPLTVDMDTMEKVWATASPVTRWREANPDAVGTDKDVIKIMRHEIERLLHEAGVEKGKETVTGSLSAVLMMVKKKT